ncbi:MAG: uroporphyrinogen-III C-methyltransferase [Lentisphaeria bacterium]|nr:uroporphyrinogen-III C-methyltransferase [Lentisphaeria bacterium]
MRPGVVSLVGAGPGEPGLITLRGVECLRQARVVVYDFLANPELLEHAPPDAERIYVGKQAGHHTLRQEDINRLLVERARAGQRVVRLKGGDPFVFGRGGEEALALRQAGIPFEVVPGVTSGIAAAACAGIPVTHRGVNSVLTLVTGHEDPGKEQSDVDWEALARGGGTLVFYMGVGNLPGIARRLEAAGRPPDTPVAVISRGTLPEQEVVEGTLDTIAERAGAAGLRPPAVIVVGEAVRLRAQIAWFEQRPLFGRTVVVTRARTQASVLACELRNLGARVLRFPAIASAPAEDPTPLRLASADLSSTDWIVFTSPNAVEAFFDALDASGGDARRLGNCAIAVTGPATAEALRPHGIRPDLLPPKATAAALARALIEHGDLTGKRILLPRSQIAPDLLPERLRQAGADVLDVVAYRTLPTDPDPDLLEAFRGNGVHAVVFTSSSTVRNFADILRRELGHLPDAVAGFSIGPETSRTAAEVGIPIVAEAEEHTIPGLVATLVRCAREGTL